MNFHPSETEYARLSFVVNRDGLDSAIKFAEQTARLYKEGLFKKNPSTFHSGGTFRKGFVSSYWSLKRFIKQNSVTPFEMPESYQVIAEGGKANKTWVAFIHQGYGGEVRLLGDEPTPTLY